MNSEAHRLTGNQAKAVDPRDSVWLSASAGTGKTQVLSTRVLRLLLEEGTEPSDLLCLTFTKAGAAEMAIRVSEVLARWVRMEDIALQRELESIGAPFVPKTRDRARSLFARVLDCPGGGLRIDTIHAFAQWLLSAFPGEAGILPGTRAMEDRERVLLADEVLSELIAEADSQTLSAIRAMSIRKGPDGVRRWLMRCADSLELWQAPAGWQPPMRERVCRLLGLASDMDEESLASHCGDASFPMDALERALAINTAWGAKSGADTAAFITEWRGLEPAARLRVIDRFFGTLLTKDGSVKNHAHIAKREPGYGDVVGEVTAAIGAIREQQTLVALADFLAPQLEAGRLFALKWDAAKVREGLVDFDDLIRRAAALLSDKSAAEWIRYKLDRQFDHILIDEAQDTNAQQWAIIDALTDDFFSGEGARGSRISTIFTVGDTKQAIFGFQGTSPKNFIAAKERVAQRMRGLSEGARELRERALARELRELDLGQSFRTAHCVLEFVDRAITAIGAENFGIDKLPEHVGQHRPGLVAQWNLVIDGAETADEEEQERPGWLVRHDRLLADNIARQIRQWMRDGFPLVKGKKPRRAGPGDVMVLVRKRRELASLIVARLYAHGVPVAGVDRLRLGAPLAVKDLMAALRFAVQPLDDLNLASLLVSPLLGWSQDELLTHGYRPKGKPLWHHLREISVPRVSESVGLLRALMARADFDSPQALLHWILIGPLQGRRALVARLGQEANDPIDELLNAANAFASGHVASLHGFIRWFDAGEGELKREGGAARGQVRVMTVHGSKGLQAPIVILADAAIGVDEPDELELIEMGVDGTPGLGVPVPAFPKDQRVGPLAAAHRAAAIEIMQEHWRLLYVAMTRAEEALFIAGSLGPRDAAKAVAPEDSWYARLQPLFESEPIHDEIWGGRREWGALPALPDVSEAFGPEQEPQLPDWLMAPAPEEARPPRPLAPSGLGGEEGGDPPHPPDAPAAKARRGVLIHALLERLPAVAPDERRSSAAAWLDRRAPDIDAATREEMAQVALSVLEHPDFAQLFGPDALAEVPLAATVGGQVIAGTADRLLVTESRVTVLDFKTARHPPRALDAVPEGVLRQMAAYVAALEVIFPKREVRAAILYTQTPQLIALPPELLAGYKARFDAGQESFVLPSVD
jgi:ATP-dependent helicase/nuclease subunit A